MYWQDMPTTIFTDGRCESFFNTILKTKWKVKG